MQGKIISGFIVILFLSISPQILFAAVPTSDQFTIIKQAPGIKLYNHLADYVMEIDLSRALIKSVNAEPSGTIAHCTDKRSKQIAPRSIAAHWEAAKKEPNAWAVFNFALFGGSNLAFPLKIGGQVISYGYELVTELVKDEVGGRYPGEYKYLRFDNDSNALSIGDIACNREFKVCVGDIGADNWLNAQELKSAGEIIGSVSPEVCLGCTASAPRIYMGIADRNGKKLLLYASKGAGQDQGINHAKKVLINFGAAQTQIIQGDGGASAQLIVADSQNDTYKREGGATGQVVKGKALVSGRITGGRDIPHALAVYSGEWKIGISDFFISGNPIRADISSTISSPNCKIDFKVKNSELYPVSINRLYVEIEDTKTGAVQWVMADKTSGQAKYETVFLGSGQVYSFQGAVSYFRQPGFFTASVKAEIDGQIHELGSQPFVVLDENRVGELQEGWRDDGSSQAILQAYLENGGSGILGTPCDNSSGGKYVHPYTFPLNNGSTSTVFVQDVCHPDKGQKTLVYKPGTGKAYLLQGCLGYLWWEYNHLLGAPTSDEIRDKTMFPTGLGIAEFEVMQTFESGSMFWDGETGLVRMFADYGTCEVNRTGTDIALCTPKKQPDTVSSTERPTLLARTAASTPLPGCADLGEQTRKPAIPLESDGFVFPVLASTQSDPAHNTEDPIGKGWKGHEVGWTEGSLKGHLGQDYYLSTGCSGTEGHPVFAVSNGRVVQVINNPAKAYGWDDGTDHGWGRVIVIQHTLAAGFKTDETTQLENAVVEATPKTVYSLYGHLKKESLLVKVGDPVAKGQKIAEIGKGLVDVSSWSCSHLHFEIKDSAGYSSKEFAPKNNIHAYCCGGQSTFGIGFGYSGTDNSAPNRYIPAAFILKNRVLDKALVKKTGTAEIYWLQNRKLYHVTSLDVINAMAGVKGWGVPHVAALETLLPHTVSNARFIKSDGQSTGLLIKKAGTPHIYRVEGDKKQRIVSPEAFNAGGHDWADVIEVSSAVFDLLASQGDVFTKETGQGAPGEGIRQAFKTAHAAAAAELGTATDSVKPVTSPLTGATGFYQTFVNGSIQYMGNGLMAGKTFVIAQDIYRKWGTLGFAGNLLGLPTGSKQTTVSIFGTYGLAQPFEGGWVQVNGPTPFAVYGQVYEKWKRLGQEKGPLGFPIGDLVLEARSGFGTPGAYQRFQGGSIQVMGQQVYGVTGAIYEEWGKNGYAGQTSHEPGDAYENGHVTWAGFPVSDPYPCDRGECQAFEGGYIWSDGKNAEFVSTTHPENLALFKNPNGSVQVSWTNRITAKGIHLYRAASPAERIARLAPGTTGYLDNTAQPGGQYSYFVSAFNETAESPYSGQLSVGPGEIKGGVRDQRTGNPVPNALVSINGVSILSLADGTYSLSVPAGQYDLSCTKPGYQPRAIPAVTISAGQVLELDITLSVSLYGMVFDRLTQNPISNVKIQTSDNQTFQNNILGAYTLGSLAPGTYEITFSHQDYLPLTLKGVTIKAGESTPLDVMLSSPLSGTVTDLSSGKILSSVMVTTGLGQTTQTDNRGHYAFKTLNPGVYDITLTKTGYKSVTIPMVIIRPGQFLPLDVQMTTPGQLNILTTDLPPAETTMAYNTRVMITGGSYPYTYTVKSGTLPQDMILDSSTGNLTGTPAQAGSYAFCLQVTDLLKATATRCFTIETAIPLSIATDALLDNGTEEAYYQSSIEAVGGTKPYTFTLSGALPLDMYWNSSGHIWNKLTDTIDFDSGRLNFHWQTSAASVREKQLYLDGGSPNASAQIELECITGTISFDYEAYLGCGYGFCGQLQFYVDGVLKKSWSGNARGRATVPVSAGRHVFKWVSTNTGPFHRPWQNSKIDNITFPIELEGNHYFTAQVQDASGRRVEKQFYLNVTAGLKIVTPTLNNGIVGKVFNQTLAASGGQGPRLWELFSGTLPPGLTLDPASGVLSGTPEQPFYGLALFCVADQKGQKNYKTLAIQVCDPLKITRDHLPNARVNDSYSEAVRISGGIKPYTFACEGKLPEGLFLDPATGIISGSATAEEQVNVTFSVTDASQPAPQRAEKTVSLATTRSLTLTTPAVLPNERKGIEITPILLQAGGGTPPYTWSLAGGLLPDGLILDHSTGVISGITAQTGEFLFTVQVRDIGQESHAKEFYWHIPDDLSLVTDQIPDGALHNAFAFALAARGGQPPYYWRIKSGTLPSGLVFDNGKGSFAGIPTARAATTLTIEVSDAATPSRRAEKSYSMEIQDTLYIVTRTLANARQGRAYTANVSAALGVAPYAWDQSSGFLPPGLTLVGSPAGATLQGTPEIPGTYTFELAVTDTSQTRVIREFTMEIYSEVVIDTSDLERAHPGQAYSETLAAQGGNPPYAWKILQGSLPDGLFLDKATGRIMGTPDKIYGTSTEFTVQATDAGFPSGSTEKELSLWVVAPLEILTALLEPALQKARFTADLTGKGGIAPYTWSVVGGSLPEGVILDPVTGVLSGTPAVCGNFEFTVQIQDTAKIPWTATRTFQWEVACCDDYQVSGTIGSLAGVTLILDGRASAATVTDAGGRFRFDHLASGSYTLTPTLMGYKFDPQVIAITDLKQDLAGLDFTALVNHPPDKASLPAPAHKGVNIGLNAPLSWIGGDPDPGDTVSFDLYFGTAPDPPLAAENLSGNQFDPGPLAPNTVYYWKMVSKDNYGMAAPGPVWQFTTLNRNPGLPSEPSPKHAGIHVTLDSPLSWTGSDPDPGDMVVYDLYFGTTIDPALAATGLTEGLYAQGAMAPATSYYWRVVARDLHGGQTQGLLWNFTTITPGQIQFETADFRVTEDQETASIILTRSHGSYGSISVILATGDGTARSGRDYTAVSTLVTFDHGQTSQTIHVPIINDERLEGDETVTLTLSDPTGDAMLGEPATAVLIIQDDAGDLLAGDVDASGQVDLTDVNQSLKVISGKISEKDLHRGADVNADGRIGMEEALYGLGQQANQEDQE